MVHFHTVTLIGKKIGKLLLCYVGGIARIGEMKELN